MSEIPRYMLERAEACAKDEHNVGVDVNGWTPVTLKEILERRSNEN